MAKPGLPEALWRFYRGISASMLCYGAAYGLSFLVSILIARRLGPQGQGVVVTVFALINIGVTLARAGIANLNKILVAENAQLAVPVFIKSTGIALAVSLPALPLLAVLGSTQELFGGRIGPLLGLLAFVPLSTMAITAGDILTGLNRFRAYSTLVIMEKIMYAALAGLALSVNVMSPSLAVALFCLAQASPLPLFFFLLRHDVRHTLKSREKLPAYDPGFMLQNALAALCFTLGPSLPPLYLGRLAGYEQAGYYGVAHGLCATMLLLPTLYSSFTIPHLVQNLGHEGYGRMKKHMVLTMMAAMALLALPLALLAHWLVPVLYGERFMPAAVSVVWLLPSVVFVAGYQVMNAILIVERKMQLFLGMALAYLGLNALLPLAWPHLTALRAAMSYSGASALVCLALLLVLLPSCCRRQGA